MSIEKIHKLESALRNVKPSPAPEHLEQRISASLKQASRVRWLKKLRSSAVWGGFALAASLLLVFGILLFNGRFSIPSPGSGSVTRQISTSSGAEDRFRPVLAENKLTNRIDEGIVFIGKGVSARRYRYEFIDRVIWKNPVDGATVEMKIPREEVILVPVQTF